MSYETEWRNVLWKFRANVYNLLDDRESTTTIDYGEVDEFGEPIKRRSVIYFDPLSFRLSLSAQF